MSTDIDHTGKGPFTAGHGVGTMASQLKYTNKQPPATVLSIADWKRLHLQISGVNLQQEAAKRRLENKEAKHQTSLNMVKNWTNTIDGQRIKRLEALKNKEIKEEEERVKIDEEEAKFQAAQRKEAIDRAKTLLYYQTDRLKGFHSGLLLSEILKEREAQIAFKAQRQNMYKDLDAAYAIYQEEAREKGKIADMISAQERAKEVAKISAFQLEQMSKNEAAKKEERKRQLEEQAAIEKEAKEWQEKELAKERKKIEDKAKLRKELNDLMVENAKFARMQLEQEKLQECERNVFAQAKKSMTKMRKAKETEIFQEFQEHQNKIANHIHSINTKKASNEDERIAKAVAEQDAKKAAAEKEKAEKLMKSMAEIDQCCLEMIMEQEQKRKEQKELEQDLLYQRVAQDQKFHASNLQKQEKRKQQAKEVEKFLRAQMVEKSEQEKLEKDEYSISEAQNLELMNVEEDQFHQYADQVISEAKSRNVNIYPLKKASKRGTGGGHGPVFSAKGGVRPSYFPCASPIVELPSYTSKELPVSWQTCNTKKRMGFNW